MYLSDVRDQAAAEAFFEQAQMTMGVIPHQITPDKEAALYPVTKQQFSLWKFRSIMVLKCLLRLRGFPTYPLFLLL